MKMPLRLTLLTRWPRVLYILEPFSIVEPEAMEAEGLSMSDDMFAHGHVGEDIIAVGYGVYFLHEGV